MKLSKHFIIGLLLLLLCGSLLPLSGCKAKDRQAKHVILISIDTLRADHLSCYGFDKKTTPNIDKFAKDCVLFEQCMTPVPFTLPAHSSMLTGTNPVYHGVHENVSYTLAPENTTLAEMFKEKGYITGAIVSAYVLDHNFGMNQGFDDYEDIFQGFSKDMESAFDQNEQHSAELLKWLEEHQHTERRGNEASQVAIEWIEKNKDENFFLFLHYYDPHDPYQPPQPYATEFKDDLYSGEIAYTDYCIKQVISKLKKLRIYKDSLIILVGDHGEGLNEHGEIQHGYYIYQNTIHVPMIIHYPGGKYGNNRVSQTTGLIDIAPTVCRWTGMEPLPEYAGKDVTKYLETDSSEDRFIYSESLLATKYGCSSLLGLVSGDWKYIQSSAPELYDLSRDPDEKDNLVEQEAKRTRVFQEELKLLLTEQVRKTSSRSEEALDAESRKKLESLGYVAGSTVEEDFEFDTDKDNPHEWLDVYLWLAQFNDCRKSGDYEKAREYCLKIQKDKPFYVMNYYYLADVQFKLGKYTEAIQTAREFITKAREKIDGKSKDMTLDPVEASLSSGYHVMGMSYYMLRQYDKAIQELNNGLKVAEKVDSDKIYNNLGNVYLAQGDVDLAIGNFQKALQVNPDYYEVYYNLGVIYTDKKEHEKALSAFEKALALKPDWEQARQKVEETKQIIDVRKAVTASIGRLGAELEQDPHNTAVLDKLGGSYLLLGEFAKAAGYWERSLAIQPENAVFLNNLAYIYAQKEELQSFDSDKALSYAQKANEMTGYKNPNYLDTLAEVHASRGEFDQALDVAQQALTLAAAENNTALIESIRKSIERYQKRSL